MKQGLIRLMIYDTKHAVVSSLFIYKYVFSYKSIRSANNVFDVEYTHKHKNMVALCVVCRLDV
jgi:hypothetical protein